MESDLVMGGDIGGTHTRIALVDEEGRILHSSRNATNVKAGVTDSVNRLVAQCGQAMAAADHMGRTVVALGLGVAGKIDRSAGTVLFSPNLPTFAGYPLLQTLKAALSIPVFIENDADCFGMGEHGFGAGRGIANWMGLTLGTGVGGCLILGGQLWRGDDLGFSGEFGHMVVDPRGPDCACGLKGCLEAHASSSALKNGIRDVVALGELRAGSLYESWARGTLTSEQIQHAAAEGNELARRLFQRMGWALGIAIANQFAALGIRHAILGGGVSNAWGQFIGPMKESLTTHSSMLKGEDAVILRSQLGDEAATVGSAYLARLHLSSHFTNVNGMAMISPEVAPAKRF